MLLHASGSAGMMRIRANPLLTLSACLPQATPGFSSKPSSQWKLHPEKQRQSSKSRLYRLAKRICSLQKVSAASKQVTTGLWTSETRVDPVVHPFDLNNSTNDSIKYTMYSGATQVKRWTNVFHAMSMDAHQKSAPNLYMQANKRRTRNAMTKGLRSLHLSTSLAIAIIHLSRPYACTCISPVMSLRMHRPPAGPPSTSAVPWVLEKDGEVVQRGVPDGPTMGTTTPSAPTISHASSYFIFSKHGSTITAFPVDDLLNFKPLPRCVQACTCKRASLVASSAGLRLVLESDAFVTMLTREGHSQTYIICDFQHWFEAPA
eukprot:1137260-Pelagomonas_calceolata.AAC.4